MNYIELINRFWQLRRSKRITNTQADLYFCLLQECNQRDWENPFQCSNGLVCSCIGVTEKTLIDARNVLKQIGVIDFENGVTKRQSPKYYLLQYWNKVSNPVSIPGSNGVSNPVSNNRNIYTKQNKTKKNIDGKKLPSPTKKDFEVRQKEFMAALVPFVETYGKQMIREFYDYWREPNKSQTLMRYEQQKTWDLKLRLNRWNRQPFNSSQNHDNSGKKEMVI